jgi:16S rRNA (guanine527-N7)-methyltransferase
VELLKQTAHELLDLELTAAQLELFQRYYKALTERNKQVNLTSIIEYEAVQIRHFLDSLTIASPKLRGDSLEKPFDLSGAAVIDIGAGAGFPGLPLKIIYPDMRLTLVESVGKKTKFLSEIAAILELENVTVLTNRAEEVGQMVTHREKYDLAIARAVSSLAVLAEYCLPLVQVGGLFIAAKKANLTAEIEASRRAIQVLGGQLRLSPIFRLPTEEDERQLIVVEKISQTHPTYPRRVGLPIKRPLT